MKDEQKTWRVLEILKTAEKLLKENQIESPRLNAELLLCEVLNEPRINLYLDFEKPLRREEISEYREKIKRRLAREPLQYILGYTEFFGMRFKVSPDVLIPRPETEIIVEKAVELISSFEVINPQILDIGTGSGCIAVSIATKTNCRIDAIDASEKALAIAKSNAELHKVSDKISFQNKDFFKDFKSLDGYDIVLSNPPYIPASEIETVQDEIKNFEPRLALTDKMEGLSFYLHAFELIERCSNPLRIFLEIGDGKRKRIEDIVNKYQFKDYLFYKDYHGTDRVLFINKV